MTLLNPGSGAPGLFPQTNKAGNINGRSGRLGTLHYEHPIQGKRDDDLFAQARSDRRRQAIDFRSI